MNRYKDKEWLEYKYITCNMTIRDISKEENVSHTTIFNWLHRYNIPCRKTEDYLIGIPKSPETKQLISDRTVGKKRTDETKRKISLATRGENNPIYGKRGANAPMFGKCHSTETRKKISKNHADVSGENNPRWKGGISYEPYCIKFNTDLKKRIRTFFNNKCVICGKTSIEDGRELSCHHINYNKDACCDNNAAKFVTLCMSCHSKTNNNREQWENIFNVILYEIYNDKSYYTKNEFLELDHE